MFLKQIDLTTALRPSYLPDEVLLFVQDNVGLYEGKYKLPNQQNGQVYLTSHRICYVDKAAPRKHSLALELKDVERYEFYAGFLKSSAKITLVPKPTKRSSLRSRSPVPGLGQTWSSSPQGPSSPSWASPAEAPAANTATWVCTICSFSNPVPSNFDASTANPHTPLPPCLACGIKPSLTHLLKAAISNATSRQPSGPPLATPLPIRPRRRSQTSSPSAPVSPLLPDPSDPDASFQCPRCTFLNHPSLLSCEICGAPLISQDVRPEAPVQSRGETESPGPFLSSSLSTTSVAWENPETVKMSFRGGGEKIFLERLKGAMVQRKWLLCGAPPIPTTGAFPDKDGRSPGGDGKAGERVKMAGIAGLERRGQAMRKNNEMMIGSAFEDLEALMARAKEIVELAERFARQVDGASGSSASENALLAESASQLGLITTRDIVGGGGSGDESLYLSELARNLAEFLADDARGVLRRAGGIVSLVDLWAMFNRARGGVELVSPTDLERAARLWEKLRLPVRLRAFKSGVLVVQGRDRTDDVTCRTLLAWLRALREGSPDRDVPWDWRACGRGVTALDAAERFGWSIGVAEEELEMAEERGVLCRGEGIEGLTFWENLMFMDEGEGSGGAAKAQGQDDSYRVVRSLREAGFI